MPRATVLIDFDGTLTERDGDVAIAEALRGEQGLAACLALAAEYERLGLSTAQYFERYLEVLGYEEPRAAIASAIAAIRFRPGARELIDFCVARELHTIIASEGLDAYILPALASAGIHPSLSSCNRLVSEAGRWRVIPAADAHPCVRCISCKAGHARRARERGEVVIVVGYGASDLCAARLADRVFARGSLCSHCEREGIDHVPWQELSEVIDGLSALVAQADRAQT